MPASDSTIHDSDASAAAGSADEWRPLWECVDYDLDSDSDACVETQRCRVPGGWLVHVRFFGRVSNAPVGYEGYDLSQACELRGGDLTFVPDADHSWDP